MSNRQLKSPNLSVVGQSGWCLAYVTDVFGIAPHYPSAIAAWNSANYKHPGEQPPADMSVPVFFSYNGPYGHVAVSVPGRGICSTSSQGDKVFGSVGELVRWMGEGFVYLGWSEDLNNVRVMEVVSDAPPAPLYTVQPIEWKSIKVKSGSRKWNLGNPDFASVAANPITAASDNEVFTAKAILHHREIPQYNYYLEDANTPHGWNVLDCIDYVPVPAPAVPQVINTPNASFQLAETYDVITKLMVFPTALDAKALSNYTNTDLEPGKYYVFARDNNAYNLSTSNVQNQNKWVRITDNVIKPAEALQPAAQPTLPVDAPPTDITLPTDPAPAFDSLPTATHPKPQYYWIRDDRLPVRLTSTNPVPEKVFDLEGRFPVKWFPKLRTEDYSMYAIVDNTEYWIPDSCRTHGWMYGVPVRFLPEEQPIAPTVLDRNANGRMDIVDIFDNGLQGFIQTSSKYLDGIKQAVTIVAPKIKPATQRIGKTIDGFSRRKP